MPEPIRAPHAKPSRRLDHDIAFDVDRFERHVFGRHYDEAFDSLAALLARLEKEPKLPPPFPADPASDDLTDICTRLAMGITILFTDPESRLSSARYEALATQHQYLSAIFRLSRLSTMDYVHAIMGKRRAESPPVGDPSAYRSVLFKYLLSSSLYSQHRMPWDEIFAEDPAAALPVYLSLVRQRVILDPAAEVRRCELLRLGANLEGARLADGSLRTLRRAWMLCSYATAADRHEIKKSFNRLIQDWLEGRGYGSLPVPLPRTRKERPTLLMGAEMFLSHHAMYRCYASYFRELRAHFRLVIAARKSAVDKTSLELFDESIEMRTLPQVAGEIVKLKPDMIFYPSLGMDDWTVLLANLRVAPIQMASLGHPATSHSAHIDYVVMGTALFGGEECFSETVMLLRSSGNLFTPHPQTPDLKPEPRRNPSPLRIAVVGKVMKLNAPFLALCARVREKCRRDVQFAFFPAETGMSHVYTREEIRRWIPDALVYPMAPYTEYLQNLAQYDVRLGTFPFGGANSNVDSLLLGIPAVVFKGNEPHSRTDYRLVRLFALPEWLAATNEAEYEAAALRLIEDEETRISVARHILDAHPYDTIFERPTDFYPNDYAELFRWIYDRHEEIKASGRKVWTWEDRERMREGSC